MGSASGIRKFKARITFECDSELMTKLVALSYLIGDAGEYASLCRQIMTRAIDERILDMDKREERRYNQILETARVEVEIITQRRLERRAIQNKARKETWRRKREAAARGDESSPS